MSEAAKKEPHKGKEAAAAAEGGAAAAAGPKKDILGFIVLGVVTLNVMAMGGMGFFMQKMWKKVQDIQSETERLATPEPEEEPPSGKELKAQNLGILYPIESFLVNIASDQGPKFLQTQMEFELGDPGLEDEIARKKPAIRDSIIVLLSSRTYKELREPAGMKKLREDILRAVNNLLTTGKLKDIYFTQFHFN